MSSRPRLSGVARWVSILLHPFAVLAALVLATGWRLDPASLPRATAGIAIAIGMVWAFVLQRKRSGRWGTVDASDRRERPMLYLLALVIAVGYWFWLGPDSIMARGVLVVVAMLCVAGIANRWIKLSLHMATLAFAAGVLTGVLPVAGIVALSMLPLLAWSRLRMARHTLPEVIGGAMLGLASAAALRWLA